MGFSRLRDIVISDEACTISMSWVPIHCINVAGIRGPLWMQKNDDDNKLIVIKRRRELDMIARPKWVSVVAPAQSML